jgi:hypothetical protein
MIQVKIANMRKKFMKIPCVMRLPFIIYGLSFLQAELTRIQFENLTLIATALVLGAKFNLRIQEKINFT